MMGSLHLDAEDEPRRGASRANSVRFDESAIHGHFAQGLRTANDFYPLRTGSAFGSHPISERSLSHKSEGRQSSTHSARASSAGIESRPLSATVPSFVPSNLPLEPPPGLFILGPVPSIIRCWLDMHFSNDSLLYAAICTGSYKSFISARLLRKLGYESQVTTNREGRPTIKLPVYLPEATIQQSSSRSGSPAPQLPTLTTEFNVRDGSPSEAIEIFLGSDVLRFRNADIHFSLDRLTLFDDERNKVSVPLVRPENSSAFRNLQTITSNSLASNPESLQSTKHSPEKLLDSKQYLPSGDSEDKVKEEHEQSLATRAPTLPPSSPLLIGDSGKIPSERGNTDTASNTNSTNTDIKDTEILPNGTTPDTPTRPDGGHIWGSWRRDSASGSRPEVGSSGSTSSYQRAGRGRGMKVLKPARLNTSRIPSSQQPVGFDTVPPRSGDGSKSASVRNDMQNAVAASDRRSFSSEVKAPLSSKPNSANPIGGASAFGWLNSGQKSSASHE